MEKENSNTNKWISQVVELLDKARKSAVRAVNQTMVYTYYEIGRIIVEEEQNGQQRAEYGKQILKDLSKKLTQEFGKGFSEDNLGNMRKFFLTYPLSISETLSRKSGTAQHEAEPSQHEISSTSLTNSETLSRNSETRFVLSWSHYLKLMRIANAGERSFYEIETAKNNWSLREMTRQIDSELYLRLALSTDKNGVTELSAKGQLMEKPADAVKDPFVLEFLGLPEKRQYSESDLEHEIIDKLEYFLLELGKGYTFVARQKRVSFDERHFYIDLVFYNRLLRCFVLIDLKIGDLRHQDLGQIQMYVNYYDRYVKLEDENPTIGIVLCKDKSQTLVEISLPKDNRQIFASRYQTVLPSKKELELLLENKNG